jgi:heme exporter protein B
MYYHIAALVSKEIRLELRQKYAIQGLLLYVVSTIFICFLSFKRIIDPPTWNALFWIIMLFAAVNAVAKSFIQESQGRLLYYYCLFDPRVIILSKMVYNLLLMMFLSTINLFFYSLFIGNIIEDLPMFIGGMILGSAGFAAILTMVSAIASKASGNATLMAILSFPILLPLLITVIRFSKNAIDGIDRSVNQPYLIILSAIITLVIVLSYLLFPYLWRD